MTIASDFDAAQAEREPVLTRAREYAAFTIPAVLPVEGQTEAQEHLRAYQSVGASGTENLVGRLLVALFPPGVPWWRFLPSAELEADESIPPGYLEAFAVKLYAREMVVQSKLDSTNYRMAERSALEDILVAGSSLTQLDDDYRLRRFRFDRWVQKRDGSAELLWIITREDKDVTRLSDEHLQKAGLDRATYEAKDHRERIKKLYTKIERQRLGGWVIRQELNKQTIAEREESGVCPYFVCGYRESGGEDYPRGFVEEKIGDLRSLNALAKSGLDCASVMSWILICYDPTKGWRSKDLLKESGSVIPGRVNGNIPDGIGILESNKARDLAGILSLAEVIEKRLGRAMLLESLAQPTGERVTAAQIMRIARELEGALGGVYAHIAEEMQRPLIGRIVQQMERDRILEPLPEELHSAVTTEVLTGIEALGRQLDLDKLLAGIQLLSTIPGGLDKLRLEVIADRILRHLAVDTNGIIKTPEEIQAELREAAARQIQGEAASKAIDTIGNVIEQQAGKAAA